MQIHTVKDGAEQEPTDLVMFLFDNEKQGILTIQFENDNRMTCILSKGGDKVSTVTDPIALRQDTLSNTKFFLPEYQEAGIDEAGELATNSTDGTIAYSSSDQAISTLGGAALAQTITVSFSEQKKQLVKAAGFVRQHKTQKGKQQPSFL